MTAIYWVMVLRLLNSTDGLPHWYALSGAGTEAECKRELRISIEHNELVGDRVLEACCLKEPLTQIACPPAGKPIS